MSRRRAQGAVLLVGAAFLFVLTQIGDLRFHWTPLLVGLSYLAAAAVGRPRGSYWATAVIITAWGAGVVLLIETSLDVSQAAGYLLAVGVGGLVAAALERRGYAIDTLGVAGATLLAGVFFALQPHLEPFDDPRFYALLLAVVGALRLARPGTAGATASRGRSGSASG